MSTGPSERERCGCPLLIQQKMMSAASRTPAEKDTRKMVMEIPTAVPAVRQLTVVASPGSVEIGSVGIWKTIRVFTIYPINYHNTIYPHSIYTHAFYVALFYSSSTPILIILLPLFCTLHLLVTSSSFWEISHIRESHNS